LYNEHFRLPSNNKGSVSPGVESRRGIKKYGCDPDSLFVRNLKLVDGPEIRPRIVEIERHLKLRHGGKAERKQLLRALVGEVRLMPPDLEVRISYQLPEAIMKGLVAGDGFEPPTFGL
jgi:hypothetical protein